MSTPRTTLSLCTPNLKGGIVTPEWRPDPFRRAQWRYFDGTTWTRYVATDGVQSQEPMEPTLAPPAPPYSPSSTEPKQRDGAATRLIVAGVMTLVSGAVVLLTAVLLFVIGGTDDKTPFCKDASGYSTSECVRTLSEHSGLFNGIGVFLLFVTAALIACGIGACLRANWGQIAIIVIAGLCCAISFVGLLTGGTSALIPLAWWGTILGLAVSSRQKKGTPNAG